MSILVGKLENRLVQIVRTAETVAFSAEKGWVLICWDWQQPERMKSQFKWVPATTRFEWVREFLTQEP